MLRAGIHLVVVDLFPPGPRDPQGIHKAIWDEFIDNDFSLATRTGSLTLASYIGGAFPEAFVELISVGAPLAGHASVPFARVLRSAFLWRKPTMSAWEAVPSFCRDVLTLGPTGLTLLAPARAVAGRSRRP